LSFLAKREKIRYILPRNLKKELENEVLEECATGAPHRHGSPPAAAGTAAFYRHRSGIRRGNSGYTEIPDNNINGDKVQPTFIQPDLRGDVHKYIRDADLELLAAKVGLSSSDLANHLNGHTSGTKTDDEIVQEGNTTENSVNNKRALANTAINEMLADVAYFYGYSEDVDIQWGRAAANSARENQELMQDYQAGTLPLREYLRRRWTDLREEDVEKLALEIEEEQKKNQIMFDERDYFGENNDNSEQAAEYAGDSVGGSGNRNKENSQG